jgi:hypothetical protein
MTPGAFAQNQTVFSEADALFAALDQAPMGDGADRWFAAVLRIYADERDWWVDVAASSDSSISVIVRLSRRASAVHAVAALRTWRPGSPSRPAILNVMCRC